MAIKKNIELPNGINLSYHRIVSINNITNHSTIIEVASYVNEEQRNKEKQWYELGGNGDMNVYIRSENYFKEYDKNLNVDNAYEHLKTLEEYADAENC